MKGGRSRSSNDLGSLNNLKNFNPHPPNVPNSVNNVAAIRTRQQRYRHQSSKERSIEDRKNDAQQSRCGRSDSYVKMHSLSSDINSSKTKVSSAPSPRSRTSHYKLSHSKKERGSRLYTFDSIPSLIQGKSEESILPIMKRKEYNSNSQSVPSVRVHATPKLPPISISKAIIPCLSQTSPVISLILIKKQSLQRLSKERISELSRRSLQRSDVQTQCDVNLINHDQVSPEYFGNAPINLNRYRSPNDASDSFEAKMLASLVAHTESAQADNAVSSSTKCLKLLNSNNFSSSVTPRQHNSLVGDSFSDDESSVTTTGLNANKVGTMSNQQLSVVDTTGMHGEWMRNFNLSQDTYHSIDITSAITDSLSRTNDDVSLAVSGDDDQYILVHYIADLDCYIEPKTGMFYESNI